MFQALLALNRAHAADCRSTACASTERKSAKRVAHISFCAYTWLMRKAIGCWAVVSCLVAGWACSGSVANSDGAEGQNGGKGGVTSGSNTNTGGSGGSGVVINTSVGNTIPVDGTAGGPSTCAASTQSAKLRPVYLAFLFDVSGSMGELDFPWHDPALKWNPVVTATRSFFENPTSTGIYASLTLFPAGDDSCSSATYTHFDVPMTALPSTAMGQVLAGVGTPDGDGTPTLAVIQGTLEQVLPMAASNTSAKYALVLVTDGTPQDCTNNTIASAAAAVRAVATNVPTYVIGVKNPPIEGAPDNVSGLNTIAEAGGTKQAFIIETGNPAQTSAAFSDTISQIRGASISCNIDMPSPPQGQELNPRRVKVTYSSGTNETDLVYDANCVGQSTWHYDNPAQPREIQLCPTTCDVIRADTNARLSVEFTCVDLILNI